jgi:hypothetical protein
MPSSVRSTFPELGLTVAFEEVDSLGADDPELLPPPFLTNRGELEHARRTEHATTTLPRSSWMALQVLIHLLATNVVNDFFHFL